MVCSIYSTEMRSKERFLYFTGSIICDIIGNHLCIKLERPGSRSHNSHMVTDVNIVDAANSSECQCGHFVKQENGQTGLNLAYLLLACMVSDYNSHTIVTYIKQIGYKSGTCGIRVHIKWKHSFSHMISHYLNILRELSNNIYTQ